MACRYLGFKDQKCCYSKEEKVNNCEKLRDHFVNDSFDSLFGSIVLSGICDFFYVHPFHVHHSFVIRSFIIIRMWYVHHSTFLFVFPFTSFMISSVNRKVLSPS